MIELAERGGKGECIFSSIYCEIEQQITLWVWWVGITSLQLHQFNKPEHVLQRVRQLF